MITIGLTGSIGMGKSTTARLFAAQGVPVWDADAAVHRLYAPGGDGVSPVLARFPEARGNDGGVDRTRLAAATLGDPAALGDLEAIVHPLVRDEQRSFLDRQSRRGADIVLLDIPLLAESGMAGHFDEVVVVTADPEIRRARVLSRPGMTAAKLDAILAKQASEPERIALATHVVQTDRGEDAARKRVGEILAAIREKHGLPPASERG